LAQSHREALHPICDQLWHRPSLEEQAAKAIEADTMLREAVAEAVYKKRYGEWKWKAALKRAKDGKLP
jgi:hypothetical protein